MIFKIKLVKYILRKIDKNLKLFYKVKIILALVVQDDDLIKKTW